MKFFYFILTNLFFLSLSAQKIDYTSNPITGALNRLTIEGDNRNMNWMLETDGSQYKWVGENYGWGLGYLSVLSNQTEKTFYWKKPLEVKSNGEIHYKVNNIDLIVSRKIKSGDLIETYTFTNKSDENVTLSKVGIYTPFNDNYPSAKVCLESRVNAHVWDGGSAAYVNAIHMSSKAPHIGLVLLKGNIDAYEISERSIRKANSNFRGVISLVSNRNIVLKPGESETIQWQIFSHTGNKDFYKKMLKLGGVKVSCNKYVFQVGEILETRLESHVSLDNISAYLNDQEVPVYRENNNWCVKVKMNQVGDNRLSFHYGDNKITHAQCLVISDIDSLISKRVNFILKNQRVKDIDHPKYGAFLVYDNEKNEIFYNDSTKVNFTCFTEGGERLGMGVLLAKYYLLHPDSSLKAALIDYADFIRNKLQDANYKTWFTYTHEGRNRAYNYPWISSFYFYMYKVTGDKLYLKHAVGTLDAMFSHFGYGFYAIDIPVSLGLNLLREAGMNTEYDHLKAEFIKVGEAYLKTGLNFPKHEVSYEQSIIAPGIMVLLQLYKETNDNRYMVEVEKQLPILESFANFQPSYHLNDIAIRHWDGYWLGKKRMWGDVFPHYWSALSAFVYYDYYTCKGNKEYLLRAKNIVLNNLCQFFEDGKASCAYLYPLSVNGEKAKFYDPFANDQDWALVYYLLVNYDL